MMIGLLYNEAQQDAKVAQATLTYILTVHRNEKIPVHMVQQCSQKVQYSWHGIANKQIKHILHNISE